MGKRKYAVGIDFGTASGRAVLVALDNGEEVASAAYPYKNGVIDELLPGSSVRLQPGWALQDPQDYLRTLQRTVPPLLKETGVDPLDVIGIGIGFTSCTMLPVLRDGTPLCALPEFRSNPHAWVKLWKHHAAQPQADRINALARDLAEPWLERYGQKISSEWFFPKALQILDEAPEIYAAADRLIEAGDWLVWRLTGQEKRSACAAGYKAMWSKREGFPAKAYFSALDPRISDVVDTKMSREILSLGERAGGLTRQAANGMGLRPETPVAVANVDAHVCVPAATVTEPGRVVMVMGTSTCHMALSKVLRAVAGICGVVEDGILPGLFGFEAGQPAVGDIFGWFIEHCVPPQYRLATRRQKATLHSTLEERAAALKPGESGLLALDWWNGNRSVLVNGNLSGLLIGATLATKPPEIYRALLEATAFGTRVIVEAFEASGIVANELVACGGLPERNKLLMQIYADVTGRQISISASQHTAALGAAMFGAVAAGTAAGGYDSIFEAAQSMARLKPETFRPVVRHQALYDRLYAEYLTLHDYFAKNDVMRRLRQLKAESGRDEAAG